MRWCRKKAGKTQKQVADELGYEQQTISKHENGNGGLPISPDALQAYARIYDMPLTILEGRNLPARGRLVEDSKGSPYSPKKEIEIMPSMISHMSSYAILFPYKPTWEYLIAKKLMSEGYTVVSEASIEDYHDQALAKYAIHRRSASCNWEKQQEFSRFSRRGKCKWHLFL